MDPALTWIDLTARDRNQMRRVLDLFSEQGTIDEMGLGSLRDALSDALFPGTSSIQTRLGYALFVPWLYQRLEARHAGGLDIDNAARTSEIDLNGALTKSSDTEGIIGSRARGGLTRLPSTVFWSALTRWGIFLPGWSQSYYHTHFSDLAGGREFLLHADDPGVVWTRQPTWHPRLPEAPKGFPWEASFALRRQDADFLRGRLEERCASSLLGWLAREGSTAPAEDFWEDPDALRANTRIRDAIELARRFSLLFEGAPLLYNLLLAERRLDLQETARDRNLIDEYRADVHEWAVRESSESRFNTSALWQLAARRALRVPEPQHRFVETWTNRMAQIGATAVADDSLLRRLVDQRERQLKGARARLANQARLLDWRGRVGVGRMDFRWFRVRQLLIDLHRGLAA
ncbi:MAG: DUF6361 family protein [Pseudomonadota bacterium]|nr:DUF6361 family protein [Pseudomonadota bacterium]